MNAIYKKAASFSHGVHPPDCKDETSQLPISQFPFAPAMVVPLQQHIGNPAIAVVREGQEVHRGQCIAEADGFLSVAMHAPVTGIVSRIGLVPVATGKMVNGIYIKTQPASTQEVAAGPGCSLESSPETIINAIQRAGIVGLGGAAFPTHAKLKAPDGGPIDTLIINGVECEPYLTTDHRVMLEQGESVLLGIRYLLRATGAHKAIIGIEANKQDAVEHLGSLVPGDLAVEIKVLPVKYPQGAEKILVKTALDREVPAGGLPIDVGVVVINVATAAEVGMLLPYGQGICERIVTISGPAVRNKGNFRIPIGTPLRFALEQAGVKSDCTQVYLGGPMMGTALGSLDVPITKGTSGFVAFNKGQTVHRHPQFPCINCGYCVDVCPLYLNPAKLGSLARNGEYTQMAEDWHLQDCFECGSCAYVCPAHIPLVQLFRGAKLQNRRAAARQPVPETSDD